LACNDVVHKTNKGENCNKTSLFYFVFVWICSCSKCHFAAALVDSLNPNIRGSGAGARAIENQRNNWFSIAFFVSFLAEQKGKKGKNI